MASLLRTFRIEIEFGSAFTTLPWKAKSSALSRHCTILEDKLRREQQRKVERVKPGEVPTTMWAQVIRAERYGPPKNAFALEEVPVPTLGEDECLIYVMAAGINHNGVWAALGKPIDVIAAHRRTGDRTPYHIGGSDASGIVWAVGEKVERIQVGDEVVIHCGWWPADAKDDEIMDPRAKIWGFEVNYGSFAQFTRVKAHALLPKPSRLSWEEAAAYMLKGATVYRMLYGFPPHTVRENDVVLIWGGATGIGSMAIQLTRYAGALPVAVVSSRERGEYCRKIGAVGVINRTDFDHWGCMPAVDDQVAYKVWKKGATKFRESVWEAIGEQRDPRIVVEHPGGDTLPTSCFVCEPAGMVVICAGTTGFNASFDIRYHWMYQKRLQGSHFANGEQCAILNELVRLGRLEPLLAHVYPFEEIPDAHQLMYLNQAPCGNCVVRIG
jgi:crotonyl-CoA carboxylase/reductase